MLRLTAALICSFLAVHLMGKKVIPWLRRLHFGQTIYELGPETHKSKQGTPIMGGMMVAAATLVLTVALHAGAWTDGWDFGLGLLGISLLSMLVGFADDYIKAVKHRHEGLTPWQKIGGQVIVAAAFACWCYFNPSIGSSVKIPFTTAEWNLGVWYLPLMFLLIIFMVNSSNLLDGLDGLLSTTSSVGFSGWGAAALGTMTALGAADVKLQNNLYTTAIFAFCIVGGLLGFLKYNRYPAQIFQGDSGSMFIGGATVGIALILRQPFFLVLISFTMILSSVSVILQRYYFKLTHGKRIFLMSPLHHHFEKKGMTETQIVSMYSVITAILTLVAIFGMYRQF